MTFSRGAENSVFSRKARNSPNIANQPHLFAEIERAGDAARLDRQGMRPFAGDQPHDVQQPRPRWQRVARSRAGQGLESRLHGGKPGFASIKVARKIRHEEDIEMRQMIGDVFGCMYDIGRQFAVGRRLRLRSGREEPRPPPCSATPSRCRRCAARSTVRLTRVGRPGSARSRDRAARRRARSRRVPLQCRASVRGRPRRG